MGPDARAGLFGTPSPGPHATTLATCGSLSAFCTAAVGGVSDPGQICITLDYRMMAINKHNLVIFQLAILTNPVRIENFHIRVPARCTFFGYALDAFSGGAPVLTHPG